MKHLLLLTLTLLSSQLAFADCPNLEGKYQHKVDKQLIRTTLTPRECSSLIWMEETRPGRTTINYIYTDGVTRPLGPDTERSAQYEGDALIIKTRIHWEDPAHPGTTHFADQVLSLALDEETNLIKLFKAYDDTGALRNTIETISIRE